MKIKDARRVLQLNALKMGVDYKESAMNTTAQKFTAMYDKYHDFYCPSQKRKRGESTVCPCEHYMKTGHCLCGLFEELK